jgi:hypothetical protein
MEFFRSLFNLAKQGQTVDAGGFTLIGGDLFGFRGFGYMEPVWLPPGDSPPGDCLAMIGLSENELTTLREFGSTRVFSMLGHVQQFYPAPYWNERNRPSRVSLDSIKGSLLAKVPRANSPGFSVFREKNRIVIRAYAGSAGEIAKALRSLAPDVPLALLTRVDPAADGALVWLPGQTQAHAITPPGSKGQRLCGSFVLFLPGQQEDQEQVLEDGYVLHLTSQSWARLRSAILSQEDLEADLFALRWIPAGFVEYLPSPGNEAPRRPGRLRPKQIVLLQPDAESQAAIAAEALVDFVKCVEEKVLEHFSGPLAKGELRVTIKFLPGREASFELATAGEFDEAFLQPLWVELAKLVPPTVKKPVAFAVEFETSG